MFLAAYRDPVLQMRGQKIHLNRQVMKICLKIGSPIAAERIVVCLGHVLFTSLVARLGTIPMAAHSIAITAEQAFYIPGYGMQAAAATLCGHSAGAKEEEKLVQYSATVTFLAVVLMGLLSAFLFLRPDLVMQIFTRDTQVIELGSKVLRLVAISEPFFAVVIVMEGIFNGVGDTKVPFFFLPFYHVGRTDSIHRASRAGVSSGSDCCMALHDRRQYGSLYLRHSPVQKRKMETKCRYHLI